jgi:hypothetical protein
MKPEKNLDLWMFVIVLAFWVAILAAKPGARSYIIGGGVAAAGAWWLRHRADRDDARREHELALAREGTRRREVQNVADEAVWRNAREEQAR